MCVCVCVRERESVSVYVSVSICACVFLCVGERRNNMKLIMMCQNIQSPCQQGLEILLLYSLLNSKPPHPPHK